MKPIITDREHIIHYYEIDYKKRALISTIMNYLSDVSMYQSTSLGMGLDYYDKNKVAWVLYKWNINIKRYPMYGEKIIVRTIPYSFRKFYAYRKFEVIDSNGNRIITADSVWLLIDTNRRRPKRIPIEMYDAYGIDSSMNKPIEINEIGDVVRIDSTKEFSIRYSDIDTNGHVNNVKYYSWAVETLPLDIVSNYDLSNVKITYKKETKYGDTVKVLSDINEISNDTVVCNHKIINNEGTILTLLETTWKKEKTE